VGGAPLTLPRHGTSAGQDTANAPPGAPQRHLGLCRNRHTPAQESGADSTPESGPHRVANRTGIRTRIGATKPVEFGLATPAASSSPYGREALHHQEQT